MIGRFLSTPIFLNAGKVVTTSYRASTVHPCTYPHFKGLRAVQSSFRLSRIDDCTLRSTARAGWNRRGGACRPRAFCEICNGGTIVRYFLLASFPFRVLLFHRIASKFFSHLRRSIGRWVSPLPFMSPPARPACPSHGFRFYRLKHSTYRSPR